MAIVQDEELLQMFIEESKEHMEGIEADFLDIEEMGEEIDSDLVNKVFRAIHSIKGGAGFLGLDTIKNLSHSMENTLNLVRNSELIPSPEVISSLLSALDTLRELIADFMSSNEVDISDHIADLKVVSSGEPVTSETEIVSASETSTESVTEESEEEEDAIINITLPSGQHIFSISEYDLKQAAKAGRILYLARFDMLNDIERKNHTPLDVIKEIQDTGMLVESKVDIESIGTLGDLEEHPLVPFYVLFSTVLEPSIAPKLINLDPWKMYQINEDFLLTPLADAPVEPEKPVPAPKPKAKKKTVKKVKAVKEPVTEPAAEPVVPEVIEKPVAKPKPAPPTPVKKAESRQVRPNISTKSTTLRVNVKLLDTLMNLAGELVLTRNQLLQNFIKADETGLENAVQRVDLITSELQEAIMNTRMQPIGTVFTKFQRVVHDMSKNLGKQVELVIEGESVELDKTIIEAIGDPLTHLVRNSMDHGIEMPDVRAKAGKKLPAVLKLSAFHEAGQVNIDVLDDGGGIDPMVVKEKLIKNGEIDKAKIDGMSDNELVRMVFKPGFSTAKEVTEVSGRGVGMDVVFSNLSKLGGSVDIESKVGVGTTIHIKLPLTLAIIPSLILDIAGGRYAIPQVNLVELVRIPAAQVQDRIEKIEDASLLRLRGELLPIVRVSDVLNIKRTFDDPESGKAVSDRRSNISDRRSSDILAPDKNETNEEVREKRGESIDRRKNLNSAYNIVVVNAGDLNYGLIVDALLDSEEIVVKPLGSHFRGITTYAGATILGDGKAALILDVMGLSSAMNLKVVKEKITEASVLQKLEKSKDAQSLLLVKNAPEEQFAIPLGLVSRIEKIKTSDIEMTSDKKTIKYRGSSLVLCSIEDAANVKPREEKENIFVIIFPFAGKEVGVLVSEIIDVIDSTVAIDEETFRQPGVLGSAIMMDRTTLLLDLYGIISAVMPDWVAENKLELEQKTDGSSTILIVEDSSFFLNQIKGFTESAGYNVVTAMDGIQGAEAAENPENNIDLILTDIEMPHMDGVQMTERLRAQERFNEIPILALTSVAGDLAEQRAIDAGIDEYLIKLDREKVLERVNYYLTNGRPGH